MTGLFLAIAIATLWGSSLIWSLGSSVMPLQLWEVGLVLAVRTFLHTGLFVIAHDAIHGTVTPTKPRWNRSIGHLALGLYGFLPYKPFQKRHWQHHRSPAQTEDPDFHNGQHRDIVRWYVTFMGQYLSPKTFGTVISKLGVLFMGLIVIGHIPWINLGLFWALPMVLSSVQLFIFGTYLPHREGRRTICNRHHARSYRWPQPWSLLMCYHFSYHWEHHEYPEIPWYQLPSMSPQG